MLDIKFLERLCKCDGISGDEKKVRELIIEEIEDKFEACGVPMLTAFPLITSATLLFISKEKTEQSQGLCSPPIWTRSA